MAKKTAVRHKDESGEFDNSAYENVRVSATFDYNEVALSYAAELIAPNVKRTLGPISFVALILLVFAAWQFRDQQTFLIAPAIIVMALLFVWSNWNRVQTHVAVRSSLALDGGSERRHVVFCDDAVHTETSGGKHETYPLGGALSQPDRVPWGEARALGAVARPWRRRYRDQATASYGRSTPAIGSSS